MEILIPSLISALALGAFCCPALARPVDYLLSGGTITTIPTFDLTAVPDWWLSGGFAAHPAGTAATLALLFLISPLFFSMEQAKGCGEDGGVLGSARIKTGTELVRGSVTWDSKASPKARGFAYGFTKGKYLFEPERHVLLDGSTGSGKTRFCLIPTIDLLTYDDGANGSEPVSIAVTDVKNELIEITGAELERRGYDVLLLDGSTGSGKTRFCLIPTIDLLTYDDGANGSEPVSIAVTDVKNELIEITGAELERRGYDVLLLDTQNPYRGHRFNPINLVVKLAEKGNSKGRNRRRTPSPWCSSQRSAGRAPLTGRSRHGAAAPR